MKIYISTYGCSANINDSEILAGLLRKEGMSAAGTKKEADIIIINTCIVKRHTEAKIRHEIGKIQREFPNKMLVIAGCMGEAMPDAVREIAPNAAIIGPDHVNEIGKLVKNLALGKKEELLGKKNTAKLCMPKLRKNPLVNIVQIAEGCVGNCSYCIVKNAKGALVSFPEEMIAREIEQGLREGCKEVWLTGQDTGTYGLDTGTSLAELLKKITGLKGDFLVRVGMATPNNALKQLEPLCSCFKDRHVFKFLHIPVQSGSDEILKKMNRRYTVADFFKVVDYFRKNIPEISFSTDIIVGFPGETEEQFKKSLDLVRRLKPDVLNRSKFGARPDTAAEKMSGKLSGEVMSSRSKRLTKLFEKIAIENNQKWLGWKGEILIDEEGTPGSFIGRNLSYKQVIVKSKKSLLGKRIKVKITSAQSFDLRAEIL